MGAAVGIVANVAMGALGGGGGGGLLGGLLGGIGKMVSGFLGGAKESGGSDGIAKAMQGFSPANVLNAAANLINSINGGAVKNAATDLHKEAGMPKFIKEAIHKAVDEILKKHEKPTDPAAQKKLDETTKGDTDKMIQELSKKIADNVKKMLDGGSEEAANGVGEGKKAAGGKKAGGSWLMAIAEAMGKVLGEKAGKMVELSNEVSAAAKEQKEAAGMGTKAAKGSDEDKAKAKEADAAAAAHMNEAQTQLQGVSQEYKLLTETISTVLKGIGESLSTMGRKQ